MGWLTLAGAILFEIAGTTCLKLSDGLARLGPALGVLVFYAASFACLAFALKRLELGVAYAIWSGLGTAIIATIAPYGPYRTADGTILLAVQNDREWRRLCVDVLDDTELATDHRFAVNSARVSHRDALNKIISARLAELSTSEATALLDEVGVANAGITEVEDLTRHPVLAGRHCWHTVAVPGGTTQALRPPVELAGLEPVMGPVPALGAHTDAILSELGRSDERIAAMHTARIV
jgi:formyl-CoA transferase